MGNMSTIMCINTGSRDQESGRNAVFFVRVTPPFLTKFELMINLFTGRDIQEPLFLGVNKTCSHSIV